MDKSYSPPLLPLSQDLESKPVLKQLVRSHQALAELKGVVKTIPNESILITTLSLQEAKDSSEIENIITTHDELFQSNVLQQQFASIAAKEVHHYATALQEAYRKVQQRGVLSINDILYVQETIEENRAGFRKLPGTTLKNEQTGEVIYTPPQHPEDIEALMHNLVEFINDDSLYDADALVKMAIIHHQFESIHPFYDGNGRTGRIINVLYLVKEGLLDIPVLYLSRYINQNKAHYYALLQQVRDKQSWEDWVLFLLKGIEVIARESIGLIQGIKQQMQDYKHIMRSQLPKIYSQDLLNNIFRHPYTKIDFVMTELNVSRNTAIRYLDELIAIKLLNKVRLGRDNYYINLPLYELLGNVGKTQAKMGDVQKT